MIHRYRQRISGPLLDRIDLHVEVPLVDYKALSSHDRTLTDLQGAEKISANNVLEAIGYHTLDRNLWT